jgi:hypothetical protein
MWIGAVHADLGCGGGGGVLLGDVGGEKSTIGVVAWRGVAAPGGNGDGWTNRETPAHRNGAVVCVKPQTKREIENNPAAACQSPSATSGCGHRRESATVVPTRHRRGADPARGTLLLESPRRVRELSLGPCVGGGLGMRVEEDAAARKSCVESKI